MNWLWGLLAALALRITGLIRDWQSREAGKKEEKLEQAEKTIGRTNKAKNTLARLTPEQRRRLRERYGRE